MLRRVADHAAVVACSTCGGAGGAGTRLIAALRSVAAEPGYEAIAIDEMPCLFACGAACAVHLRAPGRIGYVMGGFAPDADAARTILDYAVHYAASAEGEVAYADWPEGVKGHFLARIPPPGYVVG